MHENSRLVTMAEEIRECWNVTGAKFTMPPLLAVEIRSPSKALIDLNREKDAYERSGVPSYWIVNSDPAQPEVTIVELRDGRYIAEQKSAKPLSVDRPFPVTITPAALTSRSPLALSVGGSASAPPAVA